MESGDKDKSNSSEKQNASLSMSQKSPKRHKRSKTADAPTETVELNMTDDVVPLEVKELTHKFMTDINSKDDTQLTESVPRTLKLLQNFRETKDQELSVCTSKLTEMLLAALFSEENLQSSAIIVSGHPWGVQNPNLKFY